MEMVSIIRNTEDPSQSKPFQAFLWSGFKEMDDLSGDVLHLIKPLLGLQRVSKKYPDHLKIILSNLFRIYKINPDLYLSISLNANTYYSSTPSRYKNHGLGYDILKNLLDALVDEKIGLVEIKPGFWDEFSNTGRNTRIRASEKLIQMFHEHKINEAMLSIKDEDQTLILKDANKNQAEYTDTDTTIQMRKNLEVINDLLDRSWIDIDLPDAEFDVLQERMGQEKDREPIDFTRRRLRRIFNNSSFEEGGRFYHGWWQEIPKDYRRFITINGKATGEVDYSSMHPHILYGKVGSEITEDPYILPGLEDRRSEVKRSLNIIINTATPKEAVHTIMKKTSFNTRKEAEQLFKALAEKHPKIAQFLGSGEGVRLQYIDSQVAERVMLNLVPDNIVVLPVHDSFIVRLSHLIDVREAMRAAFKEIVGIDIPLDQKWSVLDDREEEYQKRPLVADQENFPGLRAPINGRELRESIFKEDDRKGYHQREGHWRITRGLML